MKQRVCSKLALLFTIMTLCSPGPAIVLAHDKQGNTDNPLSEVKSIAAGTTIGYAIQKNGSAFAWGGGVPLGDGKNTTSSTPIKMNIDHVKQIATGGHHTLILKQDGTVWAIGANEHGQLGIDKQSSAIQTKPVQVIGLKNVVAVAAGDNHSLSLSADGRVFAWGGNESGQLGNATRKNALKPIEVKGVVRILRLAAGKSVSLALGNGGEVTVWGVKQVRKGQLNVITKPEQIITDDGGSVEFFAITAYEYNAAGIDALGRVCVWNNITKGNAGTTLRVIDGLKDVVSITADCAVKSDGTVWKWTKNSKGKYVIFQVRGIKNAASITKGTGTYYALLQDGHVLSWGANDLGQAGLGTKDKTINTPTAVTTK